MQIHQLTSFTEQDLQDLAALMKELSDRLDLTEKHLRDVVTAHGSHLFVAREGGRIIGCATLCTYEAPSKGSYDSAKQQLQSYPLNYFENQYPCSDKYDKLLTHIKELNNYGK